MKTKFYVIKRSLEAIVGINPEEEEKVDAMAYFEEEEEFILSNTQLRVEELSLKVSEKEIEKAISEDRVILSPFSVKFSLLDDDSGLFSVISMARHPEPHPDQLNLFDENKNS